MLVQTECALLPETNFSMHIPVFCKAVLFKKPKPCPENAHEQPESYAKVASNKACGGEKKNVFSLTQDWLIFAVPYKTCPACYHRCPHPQPAPPAEPRADRPHLLVPVGF